MEVHEEELCTVCEQLRRCVLLVPTIPNLRLCMVCLADAMVLLAPDVKVDLTPEQLSAFQQFLVDRENG